MQDRASKNAGTVSNSVAYVQSSTRKEERENRAEEACERIIGDNLPKIMEIKPDIQAA